MKRIQITLGLLLVLTVATPLCAQVSAFAYQGRLNLNGAPANGHYDFMFRLLNDPTNGVAAPVIPINLAVPVTNGLFTTGMDFGAENFDGANRWLEINVRTNGGGPFTTLSPRQLLTPTPYAIAAHTASNLLGALPAGQISGTILNASLPASPSFSGTVTANNFSGNGAGLTNVSAATLDGLNSSNFWRTTGNVGTTAETHFLGTTDNQPLELRVNGGRAMRIEPNTNGAPNLIGGSPVNFVAPGVIGATIGGGGATSYFELPFTNSVSAHFGTIGGGSFNTIQTDLGYSTIGGGAGNTIQHNASNATIGGGSFNTIQTNATSSTIAGGDSNRIQVDAPYSAIGGGYFNTILTRAYISTISGGLGNTIHSNANASAIGGGDNNRIQTNASYATIGGGYRNVITNDALYATIPGGRQNSATSYAFATGSRAKANHTGTFVWADATLPDDFQHELASTNANSVTMRASGGYRFFTDTNATAGAFLAAGSGSWTSMSDRNAKENFRATDSRAVLEKVVALPVQTWNYKSQDAGVRHIGPMAQDFQASFGVGESATGIATVDADGVALAAIQGLNQKLEETRAENAELKQRLAELERAVRKIVAEVAQP